MKVAFLTLGCKVNKYETDLLKEKFEKRNKVVSWILKEVVFNICLVLMAIGVLVSISWPVSTKA